MAILPRNPASVPETMHRLGGKSTTLLLGHERHGTVTMKHRLLSKLLAVAILSVCCRVVCAEWLVTPEEAADSEKQFRKHPILSVKVLPAAGAPEIIVIKPLISAVIKTPVDIQIDFHSKDGAEIDTSSFRVLYGYFGMDITDRILKYGTPTEEGIRVNHAELPRGTHRMIIQVADRQQRKGQAEIEFKVE